MSQAHRRVIPDRYRPLVAQVLVNLATSDRLVKDAALAVCVQDADDVNAEYDAWLEQQK